MIVELKPETGRLVQEEIRRGPFRSVDQVIVQGVYALREKSELAQAAVSPRKPHKKLYDLLTQPPFAGSELDLKRQKDFQGPSICNRLPARHQCPLGIFTRGRSRIGMSTAG
jgi:hypothetical protein